MFDKNDYLSLIEHAKGSEKSDLHAFKIDDADGIAENIGFKTNMISKVDYFLENNHHIQLIELSDLRENIKEYNANIKVLFEKIEKEDVKSTLKTKKRGEAKKEAWKSLKAEFCQKWNGSIAVVERVYRKSHQCGNDKKYIENDPTYSLLIVCKNETEIRMLDSFVNQLNGMMGELEKVTVCTTEKLEGFVIVKV